MKAEEKKVQKTLEKSIVNQLGNEVDEDNFEEFIDNQHLNSLMRVNPISVEKDEYTIFIVNTPITRKTYTQKEAEKMINAIDWEIVQSIALVVANNLINERLDKKD